MTESNPGGVHEWDDRPPAATGRDVRIQDETLREGLQSPFAADPPDDAKVELLLLMERLGIEHVSVGIPASGGRARASAARLCREIADRGLAVRPNAGGRTVVSDVREIIELAQSAGTVVDAFMFIGSSPVRQYVEGWDLDLLRAHTRESVALAAGEGLEVTYILEDTTRATPAHLEALFGEAVDAGAAHICLCDTVGGATGRATRNLVGWSRELLDRIGPEVGLDWHGHDDRGLGLANALAAIEAGVDRVHTTALGLGERAGNTATEQLLVNLRLLGLDDRDLTALPEYVAVAADAVDVPVPHDAPVVGRDVFRTGAGVHAAAIRKARQLGQDDLADRVYCAVPASWVGRSQEILIGPQSGAANVLACLEAIGAPINHAVVQRVLERAKASRRVLTPEEIVNAMRGDAEQDDETVGVLW
jgi:2-isopropylmalate synthase